MITLLRLCFREEELYAQLIHSLFLAKRDNGHIRIASYIGLTVLISTSANFEQFLQTR